MEESKTLCGRHVTAVFFAVLAACLAQPLMAGELKTLDGLQIHLRRQGTYWYLKAPDIGLDRFVSVTMTVRDGKIHEMNFRVDKTKYIRVRCGRTRRVQLFQDVSGGWQGRPVRSRSFDRLKSEPLTVANVHVFAHTMEVGADKIPQITVWSTYSVASAELEMGYETLITFGDPLSVSTHIQHGWKRLPLSPRGLIGSATGDVMDDLIGPKVSDRPLTGWDRSVIEDPIRGPRDSRFIRWLRQLQIRR